MNETYSTFMAYNTALKMLGEITAEEINALPDDLKQFFKSEIEKQANRYQTGATQ